MAFRIGRYEIEGELGHGGFGHVYLAYDPEVDWKVAIKVLSRPEGLKYFELETVISGKLQHKNIVTIHDRGIDPSGKPYLVMELLEGETLKQAISKGELTLLQQVDIMTQVAEGLEYAHFKGVVHRDIKPENIMVLPDFTAKIMDFGIALPPNVQTVVTEGRWAGTPRYQAPEQLAPHYGKANEQTDIFSYGLVYYEVLSGMHPFKEILGPEYEKAIWNNHPEPLGRWVPSCPGALELLVDSTIAINAQHRYKKFSQIVLDSQGILQNLKSEQALILIAEARQLHASGRLEEARVRAEKGRRLDPRNRDALQLYRAIEEQLENSEDHVRAVSLLREAELRMSERRFQDAMDLLEEASRLDGGNETIGLRLAEARTRRATSKRANELFEASRASERKGRLQQALEQAREALSVDPDHTEAKRQMARIATGPVEGPSEEQLTVIRQSERFKLAIERTNEAINSGDVERAERMIAYLRANFANEPGSADALAELKSRHQSSKEAKAVVARPEVDLIPTQTIYAAAQTAPEALVRKSFWKYLGIGVAAVLVAISAIVAARSRPSGKTPVVAKPVALASVTIQADPPAAQVQVSGRECSNPDCRFDLTPGSYQVTVGMRGYRSVTQTLMVQQGQPPSTLHVTLQPAPPAEVQSAAPAKRAYVLVQVGIPDVLTFVDSVPTARTGPNGAVRLPVDAGFHAVRVQKTGYRTAPEQKINVEEGNTRKLAFTLSPEDARLVFVGAPADVEVRLGGVLLGRTNGSPEFSFPGAVTPGNQLLQIKWQGDIRPIAENFEPGQTLRVEWRTFAPPPKPAETPSKTETPVKSETPESAEAQAWDAARESGDPIKLQAFLERYPASGHRPEVLTRLDDLFWARTKKDDVASLQAFVRGSSGPHVHDALIKIDDIRWGRADRNTVEGLKKFLADYPANSHANDAQALLAKFSAPVPAPPPQAKPADADRTAILATLNLLEKGYRNLDPEMVKSAWPNVPPQAARSLSEMENYSYALQPQEPLIAGDYATVRCARFVQVTPKRGHAVPSKTENVVVSLHKAQGRWIIESIK
jgi:tetratricopeptide (TPR) repeat protein